MTGGAGFIGSNFIRYYLQEHPGDKIINLDKLTYAGNLDNLIGFEENPNYEFVEGDICKRELLEELGMDIVINFAAETHVDRSIFGAREFVRTNAEGVLNLLEVAKEKKVSRFIQISTDEVYGSVEEGSSDESSKLNPRNPYAASKASADLLCLSFFLTHGFPVLITRSTNNFGPYQYPEKFIPLMITNLLEGNKIPVYGKGENIRDWIYVGDYCRAIDVVLREGKEGEVYNVAGHNEVRNIDLAKRILKILSMAEEKIEFVPDRPGHDFRYSVDNAKIRLLGYDPTENFDSLLNNTVEWYRQNEWWWRKIKEDKQFKGWQTKQYSPHL